MQSLRLLAVALLLGCYVTANAAVLRPPVPRSFVDDSSSFTGRVLGYSCYAFDRVAGSLPCNPAHVAKDRPAKFYGSFFLGNNITFTNDATDLLKGRASEETVRGMFSRSDASELETHIELGVVGPTYGVAVIPYELKYFSVFGNRALPETQLVVIQEQTVKGQLGSYVGNDTHVGVQARLTRREYLNSQFFLTDLIAEGREKYLTSSSQSALYLEPGILHAPEDSDWNPEYSFVLKNWGFTTGADHPLPVNMGAHASASINPWHGTGNYGLGVDLFFDKDVRDFGDALTLGGYYEFGILRLLANIAEKSAGLGFNVNHKKLSLGLSFIEQSYTNPFDKDVKQNRVYAELGFEL